MPTPVATAVVEPMADASVLRAVEQTDGALTLARRCVDVAELVAVAASGQVRACVISQTLPGLDRTVLDALHAYDVAVIALADAPVGTVLPWDAVLEIPVVPDDLVRAVLQGPMLRDTTQDGPNGVAPTTRSQVVAVWGPAGAPGRSTVALGLADEASRLGVPTLLVDADVYGGAIAPMLGLLDEAPGLAAAARVATQGDLEIGTLARLALSLGPNLRVLTGISRVDRWPELRPGAIEAVLAAARQLCPLVVVDCAFAIEQDEELSYDTLAPRRNGATIAVLEQADTVVFVGGADPVAVARAMRALQELSEMLPHLRPVVVANQVRSSVFAGNPQPQLAEAYQRYAGLPVHSFLPYDRAATDAMLARGRTLAEAAPRSALRAELRALATALTGARVKAARASRASRRARRGIETAR
ncbi:chromosome partitioning protein [Epidermidibacterium keratini]|uniref:Chromosome partitioning protein n=1 Tax=Epidermidibacterium keratini TaxID=1891644 RepID=A0A7L4YRA4_9ACTN|nr:chromosome partitioning protein [Epidermidibacterium keratini]QHC01578.1 chromosome partitioning protein [Epidermidibacterium keratini]